MTTPGRPRPDRRTGRALLLALVLLPGCSRPPAAAVTFDPGPPPGDVFSEEGSALADPRGLRCSSLGPRCSAPYLRLAASLEPPPGPCAPRIEAVVRAEQAGGRGEGRASDLGGAWSEEELAERLRATLRLDLFPPESERPLRAYTRGLPTPSPGGTRSRMLLVDPALGGQELLLLMPDGPGPHPGILALPDRHETPRELRVNRGGDALVRAGYALLIPLFKAHDGGEAEDEASRALLCAGSSLMALRALEADDALRLLAALPEVDPERIGLLAHGGGGALGDLLLRLEPSVRAYTTDATGSYLSLRQRSSDPPWILGESHLGLLGMADRIARFEGPRPVRSARPGDPSGPAGMIAFFELHLRGIDPKTAPISPGGGVVDLGDVDPYDPRTRPRRGGTLSRRIELWLSSPGDRPCRDVAAADLDGDGRDELALATDDEPDRVWEVEGGALRERWVAPASSIARGAAWGDVDGDGDPDLAFAIYSGPPIVYRNDHGALTRLWEGSRARLGKAVAWADLDGDGDLDLAIADSAWSEFVANRGRLLPWWLMETSRQHEDAVTVDLNGDGRQEVAFAISEPGWPDFEVWGFDGGAFHARALEIDPGPRASALAFADVDGDGELDVALARPGDRDSVLLRDGDAFRTTWTSEAAVQTREVVWWDADRDGDPDLVLGEDGSLALYENRGGTLSLAWRSDERDDTEGLVPADVDGDGYPELAACAQRGAPLRVYRSVPRKGQNPPLGR